MAAKKTAKNTAKKAITGKKSKNLSTKSHQDATEIPRQKKDRSPSDLANVWEAAYYRYLDRLEKGLPGDDLGDWLAAESELHK